MFIFSKYYKPFNLKLVSINNITDLFFYHPFNYRNKLIRSFILYTYISIYNNNILQYKSKFNKYVNCALYVNNYVNNKFLIDSIFVQD
jgi:hypothetical protein